jgi:hypothetical protein
LSGCGGGGGSVRGVVAAEVWSCKDFLPGRLQIGRRRPTWRGAAGFFCSACWRRRNPLSIRAWVCLCPWLAFMSAEVWDAVVVFAHAAHTKGAGGCASM